MRRDSLRTARLLALALPVALMAGALGSQYVGGLVPCEMCMWQRWPHYAAIVVAALAFLVRARTPMFALVVLAALLIAVSGAIGVFHAGVEEHWWPGITACSTTTVAADPMTMLEAALKKPLVSCDVPQWTFLGISLAGYNAILSLLGAAAILILALKGRRA